VTNAAVAMSEPDMIFNTCRSNHRRLLSGSTGLRQGTEAQGRLGVETCKAYTELEGKNSQVHPWLRAWWLQGAAAVLPASLSLPCPSTLSWPSTYFYMCSV
jgi:hypothetical protein